MKTSLGAKTLLYPTPVLLIGTYDDGGRPNIMTCAWGGICCSEPPCMAVSLREATYSYGSLVRSGAFTISLPSAAQVKEADYVGMQSGRNTDKFAELGLTATKAEKVDAPYVEECPVVIECRLTHTIPLGLHTLFVGEVMDVKADETVLNSRGCVDVDKMRPFAFDPGNGEYIGLEGVLGKAFSIGDQR